MHDAVRADVRIGRGGLPEELDSFVGRRAEVAETRRLLSESRLVTLIGSGGVGKTRLALRAARESQRVFTDGAWFVELGELRDPDLLGQTVTSVLGIQDWSARPPQEVLIEHLADSRTLLVLDNCEHLVAAVADLAQTLLRACPGLSILATSREPLGVGGETVMRVPPLSVPDASGTNPASDAVELFAERARAAVPGFVLTDDTRPVVVEICERLEGLPLPIELAAARLRALSVHQILERLSDKFRLLTLGGRTGPGRQQTLRMSIDWSYDLCTVEEQALWACLSVFAGGFDLEAAEGVLAGETVDPDLVDAVASLVDKSILIREEADRTVRYRMLDTIREFGQEKLEAVGESEALHRRHRDWYERLVLRARADWIGPRQVEWMAELDHEQSNLRAALEFCMDETESVGHAMRTAGGLYTFWIVRGRFNEGRYWLDRALRGDGGSTADRIGALCVDSMLAALQTDASAAATLADDARRLVERSEWSGDAGTAALSAFAVGCAAVTRGSVAEALDDLERAVAGFRAVTDEFHLVQALYWLGFAVDVLGEQDRASDIYDEAIALTESRGEVMWRAMAMSDHGSMLWRRGETDRGTALLEDSLPLLRLLGNEFGAAWCFEELAWTAAEREPERAAVLLGAAEVLFTATGSPITAFEFLVTHHDRCERTSREALGDKAFGEAHARGAAMGTDGAIAYALRERTPDVVAAPTGGGHGLTRRELQVAELVAEGLTNRAIAERLVIAPRTVDGHVDHILTKLGFTSRTQVAAWIVQR
ncbi:ATP-binding protein [Prescottella defluvii]|uniref:ATP-binding protein n=1 Tax=Prescottella defluvii TaxID=1323361 RepID=UPI001E632C21|nr:LuxR C-terminal-related transcriptional regulator [Prescottella defluvii]